jgi:hypothetical protein
MLGQICANVSSVFNRNRPHTSGTAYCCSRPIPLTLWRDLSGALSHSSANVYLLQDSRIK